MVRKLLALFNKNVTIEFADQDGQVTSYSVPKNTSVLDALLDSGLSLPYSCKAGACKSCMMQCDSPESLPPSSTSGLSPSEIELGYFLPCSCLPEKKISVSQIASHSELYETTVLEKTFVAANIIQLKLTAPFSFKGGQFCNLFKSDQLSRSYSLASKDDDKVLEFHIKHIENGQFSAWAANDLKVGDSLTLQGPFGECFYIPSELNDNTPLLLSGIGTGMAPLLGVIRTAIEHKHSARIDLVLGARHSNNFYLADELNSLKDQHPDLHLHWLATEIDSKAPAADVKLGDIYTYAKECWPDLSKHQVYLCGAPSFIQKMKKQCYLSGASMNAIFSDIFQPAN